MQTGLVAGRVVYFVFDETSAHSVAEERAAFGDKGNQVKAGDIYPAMVVRTWGNDNINLKVMLDGPDTFWATSVGFNADRKTPRSWHWMFDGQAERYTPDRTAEKPAVETPSLALGEDGGPGTSA